MAPAFAGFLALGLPDTTFGVAWPSIRHTFGLPLSALGLLLAVYTAAYLVAGATTGTLLRRFGTGRLLAGAALLGAAGLSVAAVAPWWVALLAGVVPIGFCGGLLDAALNAHVALTENSRVLGLLHGAYGVGATVGPLIFTAVLALGGSWRWGYAVAVLVDLVLAGWFWRLRTEWDDRIEAPDDEAEGAAERRARDAVVAVSLLLFFVYVGVEATAGQWAYTVLTEGRGMGPAAAGLWVAAYWGALTAGRIAVGLGAVRLDDVRLLAASCTLTLVGVTLFWWNPTLVVGALGLPIAALGMAAIFPTLIGLTPSRVGADRAAHVIGLEVAAAALAGGLLPGLTGVLLDARGLESLGPALVAAAVLLFGLDRLLVRLSLGP